MPIDAQRTEAIRSKNAASLFDLRFARQLGAKQWGALPPAIRRRFSKRLRPGTTLHYAGEVEQTRLNLAGWCLAQCLRPIGAPLPLNRPFQLNCKDKHRASVYVTEDAESRGQCWTRRYHHANNKKPQTITSVKRFSGPTGCEEWVTPWLGMALRLSVDHEALTFASHHYVLKLFGRRHRLPRFASPGTLTVRHAHISETHFRFTLTLTHAVFGTLVNQAIIFQDNQT